MKRIYLAQDYMEAQRLQEYLQTFNIPVYISDEFTHSLQAVNPMAFPALWVEDDYDTEYVRAKIRDFLSSQVKDNANAPAWICPACGESNPGTFECCWHCMREK